MTQTTLAKILGALAVAALPLGACAPDRVVTGSTYPSDYQERHPIVLARAPTKLDLFLAPGGLDPRQREDIHAFGAEYRRYGEGSITVEMPDDRPSRRALGLVRSALAQAGVAGSRIAVAPYPATDRALAAPIRLSFTRMQAKVGGRCGLWPQDLGVSDPKFNAGNDPYWNLGCAMQSNVASQVADPLDLVRGRSEGRVDTVRRMNNIEKLRQGEDPSTAYRADDDKINQVVGQ
jgi:pilus assembly protein CpaD